MKRPDAPKRAARTMLTSRRSMFFVLALGSAGFGSFALIHLRNQHRTLPHLMTLQPGALGRKGGAVAAVAPTEADRDAPKAANVGTTPTLLPPSAASSASGCAARAALICEQPSSCVYGVASW